MAGKDGYKVFVGGLSWDITQRQLENAFNRFGKVIECQIMLERDTGRPRGFGFVTFADRRSMDDAIKTMDGREFGERVITVNRAQPKAGDDLDHGFRSSGGRGGSYQGGYGGRDRPSGDECFKCGRPGHWARDCPSAGGRGEVGGSFPPRSRFSGASNRGDRFGDRDRYMDEHYAAPRYGDQSRDNFPDDRYPPAGYHSGADRYGGSDRYAHNGYGESRVYDRDMAPRVGSDMYGPIGPARNDRSYRERPGPYNRPSRGRPAPSFERY